MLAKASNWYLYCFDNNWYNRLQKSAHSFYFPATHNNFPKRHFWLQSKLFSRQWPSECNPPDNSLQPRSRTKQKCVPLRCLARRLWRSLGIRWLCSRKVLSGSRPSGRSKRAYFYRWLWTVRLKISTYWNRWRRQCSLVRLFHRILLSHRRRKILQCRMWSHRGRFENLHFFNGNDTD